MYVNHNHATQILSPVEAEDATQERKAMELLKIIP
jgi:hypothetical protein